MGVGLEVGLGLVVRVVGRAPGRQWPLPSYPRSSVFISELNLLTCRLDVTLALCSASFAIATLSLSVSVPSLMSRRSSSARAFLISSSDFKSQR